MNWPEELDVPVTVCTAHLRFVPCRHGGPGNDCVHSSAPEDVAQVREWQNAGAQCESNISSIPGVPAEWRNAQPMSVEERLHIALLRLHGCLCELPLLGTRRENWQSVPHTFRCRVCGTEVRLEPGSASDRPPLPFNRFHVDAMESVVLHCWVCGGSSPGMGGGGERADALLLSDLTDWATSHRCPGLRVT